MGLLPSNVISRIALHPPSVVGSILPSQLKHEFTGLRIYQLRHSHLRLECWYMSSDADLWGSEDPDFIDALANATFSGEAPPKQTVTEDDAPTTHIVGKRKRSITPTPGSYDVDLDERFTSDDDDMDMQLELLDDPDVNPALFTRPRGARRRSLPPVDAKNEDYVYGKATFGGFGEYMFRKRAKLQFQNQDIRGDGADVQDKSTIFKGVAVYVGGPWYVCSAAR